MKDIQKSNKKSEEVRVRTLTSYYLMYKNIVTLEKEWFMSLQKKFNMFDEEIRITWQDDKMKEIREKNKGIEKDIKSKFKEVGYPVVEVFNQGSYATNMSIIPHEDEDYDIDRGIVIDADKAPEDPREAKKVLRDVLVSRNLKDPKIKKPCVTAQYYEKGEEKFHIDYPIYKKDSQGRYFLAVGKEHSGEDNREWEEVEIRELIDWLDGRDEIDGFDSDEEEGERQQYKRLVRYMKSWRDNVFTGTEIKHIYSVGLTVMVKEQLQSSIDWEGDVSDIDALYNTVCKVLDNGVYFSESGWDVNFNKKYNIVVELPKLSHSDIFRKHGTGVGTTFRNKLQILKEDLENIISEDSLQKQCEILRDKVFGDKFPVVEDKTENKKFDSAGYVSSPQGA